jgi:Acyl-CoA thioesterase C-terminal domain/Acyl-CoA thioesterase N-terminal domain
LSYARAVPESTREMVHDPAPTAATHTAGRPDHVTRTTAPQGTLLAQNRGVKESFYVRVDTDTYEATELTRGPWDAYAQHAGPPAALLGHVIENRAGSREDMRIARITFDIIRRVPLGVLQTATKVVHQGRRVEVVEATLDYEGKTVMRASALRIRAEEDAAPSHQPPKTVTDPNELQETQIPMRFDVGYHTAMETRNAKGAFHQRGPATVWFRMRHPLIDGEEIAPLDRLLIAADSGNGVSGVLPISEYVFINPELTVHLHRYPTTEWVCLDAVTHIDGSGIGLADTVLHDEQGPIGRGSQSLYVARQAGSRPR